MSNRVFLLWCAGVVLGGCAAPKKPPQHEWVARHTSAERVLVPPEGKALVNFHRPTAVYYQFTYAIYNASGSFLSDVPGFGEFQHVCEPGEQIFIGWLMSGPISVVQADLAAGKVYDVLILEGASDQPKLMPLVKGDARRSRVAEFEAAEVPVSLLRLPRVEVSEAKVQPKIEQIRKDFLGGSKSGRVLKVTPDDCR